MASFIIGILSIIGGLAYLVNLWTRRAIKEYDYWNIAMLTKGIFGGIGVVIIGIALIVRYWPF